MYEFIKGTLAYTSDSYAVVEAGGIGYKIITPKGNLNTMRGESVTFYTYLHVAENVFELFGFVSAEERASFLMLLSVSGVGPKAAMSVLSTLSPSNLAIAILTNNPKAITAAPGVGSKVASRIILELKDKIDTKTAIRADQNPDGITSAENDAVVALTALGYSFNDAVNAISKAPDGLSVEDTIKFALKQFVK